MGVARVASRAQLGLSAPRVEVEVHLGGGLPVFNIVGMPATAVRESKDRVRAERLAASEFYGELGLAGELRPIRGVLLAAAHAAREQRSLVVPAGNVFEARIAAQRIFAAESLLGVCALARAGEEEPPVAQV